MITLSACASRCAVDTLSDVTTYISTVDGFESGRLNCHYNRFITVLIIATSCFSRGCIFGEAIIMHQMLSRLSRRLGSGQSLSQARTFVLIPAIWTLFNLVLFFTLVLSGDSANNRHPCWSLIPSPFTFALFLPYNIL